MKLQKQSLIIKWAYLPERILEDKGKPTPIHEKTNLCNIIGRVFIGTPTFVVLALPMLAFFIGLAYVITFVGVGVARLTQRRITSSVLYTAFMDFKNKTCTRVEIIDTPKPE
jgi:hypothetical protein